MINYGVVGVGYFGVELVCFMNMYDNVKIICVYDFENGENIVCELQCINMLSLDVLVLSKLVDCVIVVILNYLYKELVIKVVKNKKYVFCEKLIVLSYEDCVDMVKVCKEVGVIFMVGYIMNFFNGV